ncbi:MAG: glycosyltransferase family 39 protein [Deltaproteobacteria bacterium]|nr:glycosyltransferase family 39 protein [Deltaproteobacteria bacterium]
MLLAILLLGSAAYVGYADFHGRRGGVAELDGYYYYIYLRSLQVDGDIDFHDEYRDWGNPFGFGETQTKHARNIFGVGPAVLWSPFFLAANAAAATGRALGIPISSDPMSRFHQRITFYGSLFYGWLALLFAYLLAREVFGKRWALAGTLGAALAGPLPYYCLGGSAYSHAGATFATTLLAWLWLRHRRAPSRRSWIALGAASGLAFLARPATAPFALILLWEASRQIAPALRPLRPRRLSTLLVDPLLAGLAALIVFSPQLIAWNILFGSPLLVPQGHGFFLFADNAWAQTLFAPRNGLLPSAPILAAALLGLALMLERKHRPLALPLGAVFIGILALNGAVYDWWGWNFSARRFTSALPLFVLGLTRLLDGLARRMEARPQRTVTAILVLGLLFAVLFNLEWLRQYTERNLKWYSVRSTRGLYMTVANSLVDRVYDKIGNPLSLPATLAFNAQRGGAARVYDRIQGSYLLGETNPETLPAGKPFLHAMMPLSSARFRLNLSPALGAPRHDARGVAFVSLRAKQGFIFLPINRPGPMDLWIRAQARFASTRVDVHFNGMSVGHRRLLPPGQWTTIHVHIPGTLVARGINRLDLQHHLPAAWTDRGPAHIGSTGATSPADLAVTSGGKNAGRFCDIWLRERRFPCGRGINVLVIDARDGHLLGRETFDAHVHPAAWPELTRYLDHFPQGSIVALGGRDDIARHFAHGGAIALARLGAITNLKRHREEGYAAIGVLDASRGTALEASASTEHARAHVGRVPPSWRQAVWYSALRLR